MSCKHEWDEPESKDTYCTICGKSTNEVRLEQQLAAANARVEKAEARCAAIATAFQNMKGDFEHWAYCELIDSPPGKKCTCGVWEMVEAIEAASEGKS